MMKIGKEMNRDQNKITFFQGQENRLAEPTIYRSNVVVFAPWRMSLEWKSLVVD